MSQRRSGIVVVRAAGVAATGLAWTFAWAFLLARPGATDATGSERPVLRGQGSAGDWTRDAPGVRRVISASDLPPPGATESADHGPRVVPRPPDAWPKVPAGFRVELVATGLENPRNVVAAPNGDLFVVESAAGRVRLLRPDAAGRAGASEVFASGLRQPFGIAFHPPGPNPTHLYVADTDEVVRFPYRSGDRRATGPRERVVRLPGGGHLRGGGHWTRDVAFSRDGARMYVSIGSFTNVAGDASDAHRAEIRECDPDGRACRVYATGIRNAVGLAVDPATDRLWASVDERDGLGDDLVPDYVTHVAEGGFYGWPWFYLGAHQDPRHPGAHPELAGKVLVPDVLVQSHSAPMRVAFCASAPFPADHRGDAFVALHGSWNRSKRTGYKIVRVLLKDGEATGEVEDFVTGFVVSDRDVWGRPVGLAFAPDGSLVFTDDGSGSLWRVRAAPRREARGAPR